MNELIEKIYGKACLGAGNLNDRDFCEHFAELIIRECAEIAGCNGHVSGFSLGDLIKERFGVQ